MISNHLGYMNYNATSIRDVYNTPRDRIWGDVIKHERVLEQIWKETWGNTVVPKELRPEDYIQPKVPVKDDIRAFFQGKPSPPVPSKASAMIGWRSSDPQTSLEYFNVKYISDKKRFVKEEFGYYRALKYYQEEARKNKSKEGIITAERDEKFVKHTTKRLIC